MSHTATYEQLRVRAEMAHVETQKKIQAYSAEMPMAPLEVPYGVIGSVAIIPICGGIERYDNIFMSLFGGTSVSYLMDAFEDAIANPDITAVLFDVNSPGGSVDGPPELAEMIYSARGGKPIWAYVSRQSCSAAYWLSCACEKIISHPSAEVGSVGVITSYIEEKNNDAIEHVIVSKNAGEKYQDPNTPEGLKLLQNHIDAFESVFIKDIALYRAVSEQHVISSFGSGNVLFGEKALSVGMIDEIGTFKNTVKRLNSIGETERMTVNKPNAIPNQSVRAEAIESDQITAEWVEANLPAVYEKIKALGASGEAEKEAARLIQVESIEAMPGYEAVAEQIKKEARLNRNIDAMQVWNKIQIESKKSQMSKVKAFIEDASAVSDLTAGLSAVSESSVDAERKHLLSLASKRFNGGN